MAKKHKCPECPPKGSPPWMATYADLLSLLLTFFVLLLSFATMNAAKFAVAMTSLRGALGVLNSRQGASVPISNLPMFQIGKGRIDQVVEQAMQQIKEDLSAKGAIDQVQVSQEKDKLHFSIAEPLLFESGRAILRQEADDFLSVIATILNMVPFEIRIEGHTDNIPIRTVQFPSNWELSYSRGLAIAQKFIEKGISASRFQVIGYGDTRPIADNTTPQGRAINRRVEIIVNLRDEIRRSIMPE